MDILETFVPVVDNFEIKYFKPVNCDLFTTLTLNAGQIQYHNVAMQTARRAEITFNNDLVDAEGTVMA